MKNYIRNIILTGAAGALLAPALQAQTIELLTVGGNASIQVIQSRVPSILSGAALVSSSNSKIFRYTGTYNGTNVIWHFNLTGGTAAIGDIVNGNQVAIEDNTTRIPVSAVTITSPESAGFDSTPAGLNLVQDVTLVAPIVYIENPSLAGIVTNLTQRQAYELAQSKATVPVSFFGGTSSSPLYYVGRNSASAVKTVLEGNIFFKTTAFNYHTNGAPGNTVVGWAGGASGADVTNSVAAIPNSVGTVAVQDAGSFPRLTYEGVAYSTNNVISGKYPIWGYERYIYFPSSDTRAPSSDQLGLIQALEAAVEDPTFQADPTKPFLNNFLSFNDVNAHVKRDPTVDGSLILPGSLTLPIP